WMESTGHVNLVRRFTSPRRYNNDRPRNYHWDRKQHAHGEPTPQKAELRVRLAEMLADDAGKAIERDETAEDQARPLQCAEADHHREHGEQQNTFESGFVELARMPRQRSAIGKDHRPGQIGVGRPAPQLAVDE